MKSVIALSLLGLALGATPAWGDEQVRKTELADISGKSVDRLQIRYDFDGSWVIDNRRILYRDTHRDHYLVTLKEECKQLDSRRERVRFFPSWTWELRASNSYELKPKAGRECDVAAISMIDEARANELRASVAWRNW